MSEITSREELNTYDFDTLVGLVITMQHQGADREALITELIEENRELNQQNKEIVRQPLLHYSGKDKQL